MTDDQRETFCPQSFQIRSRPAFDYRYTNSLAHDSFSQQTIAEALMGGTITVVTFQPVTEACSISKAHIAASLISTTPLLIRFIRDKHFDEGLF